MNNYFNLNIILILCAFVFFQSCAEREERIFDPPLDESSTIITGSVSGTLKISDSPFYVKDNIIVDSLKSIIIEAGVEIYFPEGKNLTVYGNLIISGNNENPVLLTSEKKDGSWSGIKIINSANSSIHYCEINKIEVDNDTSAIWSPIIIINSNVKITNSIIINNRALSGGAIYTDSSTVEVTNCIFSNNYAAYFGAAMFSEYSSLKIINNTFSKNSTPNYGGGIILNNNDSSDIENNIFDKNTNRVGNPSVSIMAGDSAKINFQYNFLSITGINPHFVSENNFHLSEDSPCKNSGNPASIYNDFDGTRNDQGAFGGPGGNW